jgi:chromosome segregation ATPase
MNDLEQQVKRIQEKLQQLLRQRESLLKENGKLKDELRQLKEEKEKHTLQIGQFQQQVDILKATKEGIDDGEKRDLEKRLGHYIREIDRCIALLSE